MRNRPATIGNTGGAQYLVSVVGSGDLDKLRAGGQRPRRSATAPIQRGRAIFIQRRRRVAKPRRGDATHKDEHESKRRLCVDQVDRSFTALVAPVPRDQIAMRRGTEREIAKLQARPIADLPDRSEERQAGTECGSKVRSRGSPYHS